MKKIINQTLTGERAAYASTDTEFVGCTFEDGESPIKESRNVAVTDCTFGWKYPLWYCDGAKVTRTKWLETARSGVWYTNNLEIRDSFIGAPKQFRRCENVTIENSDIPKAQETLWDCRNVKLRNMHVVGDYFGFNSDTVNLKNVRVDGNYCFDGGKNIVAEDCIFNTKDSFWNCENVVLKNCVVIGEYIGWNSKNLTFINCEMESNQGFCYIDGLKLVNCKLKNTDLAFELCKNLDVEVVSHVDSIKNPISGIIRVKSVGELILDKRFIDPTKTVIKVGDNE